MTATLTPRERELARHALDGPGTKREARRWIRQHWAYIINNADMGGVADLDNQYLNDVWSDECKKISHRLAGALAALEPGETLDEEDFR